MNTKLQDLISSICPVDNSLEPIIMHHLDDLTKPPGSLGKLEQIALKYCLMTGSDKPQLGAKKIFTFGADHGVADEGVSAFPKVVTQQMVMNMLSGGAAINVLARHAGAELAVVDMGVDWPQAERSGLLNRSVRAGTANMAVGPAMSVEEAEQALLAGIELAEGAASDGFTLLGTGEMGIANTTPSAALFAALLPCPVEEVTGRGTGVDDQGLQHKISIIKQSLTVNKERMNSPLETLAAVGGLEIAGICGLILGAAARRLPVIVDGFISSAGALVACRMNPAVRDYLFFSHLSQEAGHQTFFNLFEVQPILDLGFRLGEGTGAAMAMPVIEAAIKIYNEMATFSSAGISAK
ncbi:MAG: nicotinate-nucleotide--dimethylbenzimidazole phosphoribosyltransferase [Deltaproteobacteria bacterium]|nr:nicotinate-nucleotide--dimethylbenzimidazole phosphoribosyltransferase [Deltaproteobacteria bacterium]